MPTLAESLPTLLGVALGAAGATLSSVLIDRLRWRREQAVRWDQRRLEAYTAFAATLKEITSLGFRLAAHGDSDARSIPLEPATGLQELAAANLRRTTDWEPLLLLADEATVAAARTWRDATAAFEQLCRQDAKDATVWQRRIDQMNVARDDFYIAARRSLGVYGSVRQLSYLPRPTP